MTEGINPTSDDKPEATHESRIFGGGGRQMGGYGRTLGRESRSLGPRKGPPENANAVYALLTLTVIIFLALWWGMEG